MYALRNLTSCVFFITCEIWVRNIRIIDTKFSRAVRNWYQFFTVTKCQIYGSTMLSFKHVVFILMNDRPRDNPFATIPAEFKTFLISKL